MAGSWKDFKKNPMKFCEERFRRALNHQSQFRDVNVENLGMYEGRDPVLEERAMQKDVMRSSMFMQILAPAIDTNVADALAVANGMVHPITVKPRYSEQDYMEYIQANPSAPQIEYPMLVAQAEWIEENVNRQLRECGYIPFGFQEQLLGAEIYRTPSVVKVGWRSSYRKEAEIPYDTRSRLGMLAQTIWNKVNFRDYDDGEFCAEFIPPDEFLYDPMVSIHDFHRSCFSAHVVWRTEEELLSQASYMGYAHNAIREFFDGKRPAGGGSQQSEDIANHRKEALSNRDDGAYWEQLDPSNRALVVECYLYLVDNRGEYKPQYVVMLGGKKIINKDMDFTPPYQGFCHPFVPLVGNPMPGTMEGLSSVDLGRGHQRAYNDTINVQFDALAYHLFGPMKMSGTNGFLNKPVHRLGAIWQLRNAEDLQPVLETRTPPELTYLLQHTDDNLQRALNTSITRQGVSGNPYEKATQTNLRSTGAQRRSVPKNARFGKALCDVANFCILLNQQFSPKKVNWVIPGGLVVDAPGFTHGYDREAEKQDALLLLSTLAQLPLYQSGTGQDKIRQIAAQITKLLAPSNYGAYTITKEEMVSDINAMAQAQAAASAIPQGSPTGSAKESSSV